MWKFMTKQGQQKIQDAAYMPIENVIQDQIISSDQAVITFDNIPQIYSHLHIDAKTSWTVAGDDLMGCRVNGDVGATNHVTQMLNAHAATANPFGYSDTMWYVIRKWLRASWQMDIPDYSRPSIKMFNSKYYTTYNDAGPASADGQYVGTCGGYVMGSVGPITKLEFMRSGKVFAAGSRITLYGRSSIPLPRIQPPTPAMVKLWDSIDNGAALGAASITTDPLPAGYKHLKVVGQLVASIANNGGTFLRINGDAATNHYFGTESQYRAGAADSYGDLSGTSGLLIGNDGTMGAALELFIPNYADVTAGIVKDIRADRIYKNTVGVSNVYDQQTVGFWNVPGSAVQSLSFVNAGAAVWSPGTRITVYGMA